MTRATGHRIAHAAIALICLTRAIAYSRFITPPHDSPGPLFLTDEGRFLWIYALIWVLVAVLAITDGLRRRTSWAIPAFIGIVTVWGGSYLLAWAHAEFHTVDGMTGCLYLGLAGITLGAHLIITAQDAQIAQLHDAARARITGSIREVRDDDR